MAGNVVGIIGVRGLTRCQHYIVCDVYQGVDGAHTRLPDAVLHPVGGGLDADTLDLGAGHTGAPVTVLHGDMEAGGVFHIPLKAGEVGHGQIVKSRDLPGDTVVAPEVGAVGHGFVIDLQNDVIEVQRVRQRRTCRGVKGGQVQNGGFLLIGEEVKETDFAGGADHAVAGNTPELALFNLHRLPLAVPAAPCAGESHGHLFSHIEIGAAADNIFDFTAADVSLADFQLVGVGMLLDGGDKTHHHAAEILGQIRGVLHLHGGHGQVVGKALEIHIVRELYIVLDPIQRNFHCVKPSLISGTASGSAGRRCGTGAHRPRRSASSPDGPDRCSHRSRCIRRDPDRPPGGHWGGGCRRA